MKPRNNITFGTDQETKQYIEKLRQRGLVYESEAGRLGEYLRLSSQRALRLFSSLMKANNSRVPISIIAIFQNNEDEYKYNKKQIDFMNLIVNIGNTIIERTPDYEWKAEINSKGGIDRLYIGDRSTEIDLSDHLSKSYLHVNKGDLDIDVEVNYLINVKKKAV